MRCGTASSTAAVGPGYYRQTYHTVSGGRDTKRASVVVPPPTRGSRSPRVATAASTVSTTGAVFSYPALLRDDFLHSYLKRFPEVDWDNVVKHTLIYGIQQLAMLGPLSNLTDARIKSAIKANNINRGRLWPNAANVPYYAVPMATVIAPVEAPAPPVAVPVDAAATAATASTAKTAPVAQPKPGGKRRSAARRNVINKYPFVDPVGSVSDLFDDHDHPGEDVPVDARDATAAAAAVPVAQPYGPPGPPAVAWMPYPYASVMSYPPPQPYPYSYPMPTATPIEVATVVTPPPTADGTAPTPLPAAEQAVTTKAAKVKEEHNSVPSSKQRPTTAPPGPQSFHHKATGVHQPPADPKARALTSHAQTREAIARDKAAAQAKQQPQPRGSGAPVASGQSAKPSRAAAVTRGQTGNVLDIADEFLSGPVGEELARNDPWTQILSEAGLAPDVDDVVPGRGRPANSRPPSRGGVGYNWHGEFGPPHTHTVRAELDVASTQSVGSSMDDSAWSELPFEAGTNLFDMEALEAAADPSKRSA